jgi:hypothetical protein
MNKIATLLLCALLAPAAIFAGGFEGKIRFSAKSPRHAQLTFCDYFVKSGFLRIDFTAHDSDGNDQDVVSVWDLNQHLLYTLMPSQKTYSVMKTADITGAAPAEAKAQFDKTGETETILGLNTVKYLFKDSAQGTTREIWAAEGIDTFISVRSAFLKHGAMTPLEQELAARGLFPLRIVYHDSSGAETSRLEAVSIDKKKLPDDTFTVPDDYHTFDAGNMSGGF